VGEATESARAQVVASRTRLDDEFVRLEASARAAVDVKTKVKKHPVKTAGVVAGVGFVAVGGPKRVFRGVKHAIFGKPDPLPKSLLPDEIEAAVSALGSDGAKVRGKLEREFGRYLRETAPLAKDRDLFAILVGLFALVARPTAVKWGKQLAQRAIDPDPEAFAEQVAKIKARRLAAAEVAAGEVAAASRTPAETPKP
jgi:hypothetical protein